MTRIVLDITTTSRWTSPDVGITRTERKFAEYLLNNEIDSTAFVRTTSNDALEWIAPDRVASMLGLAVGNGPSRNESHGEMEPDPSDWGWKRRTADFGLRRAKRITSSAIDCAERLAPMPARHHLRAAAQHSAMAAREVIHSRRHHEAGIDATTSFGSAVGWDHLGPADTYVALGLDWDDKSIQHIYRMKQRYHFRSVHLCYDLIPAMFPEWLPSDSIVYDQYFLDLLHTGDAFACISDESRRALQAFAISSGLAPVNAATIHLGADFAEPELVAVKRLDGERFVLFVSTIEPRKNHRFLLEVWERVIARGLGTKLVFVGKRGWKENEVFATLSARSDLSDHVLHLDQVTDSELAWLYERCLFTVFPSLYEGWGLPVVESLLHGKVCIASTAKAVQEAGLGLAIHIDVFEGQRWVDAVCNLISDPDELVRLEQCLRGEKDRLLASLSWSSFGERLLSFVRTSTS